MRAKKYRSEEICVSHREENLHMAMHPIVVTEKNALQESRNKLIEP